MKSQTKKYISLKEFLKSKGVNSNMPKEEISALKKEHEKGYHRWYHQHKRKKESHRFTLRLSHDEYKRLLRHADANEKKNLGEFIKKSAFSFLDKHYVRFHESSLQLHRQDVTKIGNNINQVVQSIHRMVKKQQLEGRNESAFLYEDLIIQILELQKEFNQFILQLEQKPPLRLDEALYLMLLDNPEKLPALQGILNDFKN